MGFATFDLIRNEDDLRRCHQLVSDLTPDTPTPNFYAPLSATLVARDGDDKQIQGLVHTINIPEVRILLANPEYPYHAFVTTVLYNQIETNLRTRGFDHYYINIPETNEKLAKEHQKMGAVKVDPFADRQKIVRLLKRL